MLPAKSPLRHAEAQRRRVRRPVHFPFLHFSNCCITLPPMEEKIELRVYGDASLPTLVYLPGMHGDWTLIGGFRSAILGKVRFVEMSYPRTLTWSLDDHAAAIENALVRNMEFRAAGCSANPSVLSPYGA